ncbi:uncharacterized protein LOC100200608 isoform X7 [Hydra vulgaris]|uniref:Uncharacterized protein LOC100200608 isoform X7 n=1 Tax=Hydra vulgaris TaxID=6087 RepID=A0ABM4DFW6_HYDVU
MLPNPVIEKVKPYSVVDLATNCILSDEEVTSCLKTATHKQLCKEEYNEQSYAKYNGDAPNFINLPPKLTTSRSTNNFIASGVEVFSAYNHPNASCSTAPPFIENGVSSFVRGLSLKETKLKPTSSHSSPDIKHQLNQQNMQVPRNYVGGLRPPMQLRSPSAPTVRLKQPDQSLGKNKATLPRMYPHSSYSTTDSFHSGLSVNMEFLNKLDQSKEVSKLNSDKYEKLQKNQLLLDLKHEKGSSKGITVQTVESNTLQSNLDIEAGKQTRLDMEIGKRSKSDMEGNKDHEFHLEKNKHMDKPKFSKIPSTFSTPRSMSSLSVIDSDNIEKIPTTFSTLRSMSSLSASDNTENHKSTELEKRNLSLESIERPKIDTSSLDKTHMPNKTMAVSQFASVSKLRKASNPSNPNVFSKLNTVSNSNIIPNSVPGTVVSHSLASSKIINTIPSSVPSSKTTNLLSNSVSCSKNNVIPCFITSNKDVISNCVPSIKNNNIILNSVSNNKNTSIIFVPNGKDVKPSSVPNNKNTVISNHVSSSKNTNVIPNSLQSSKNTNVSNCVSSSNDFKPISIPSIKDTNVIPNFISSDIIPSTSSLDGSTDLTLTMRNKVVDTSTGSKSNLSMKSSNLKMVNSMKEDFKSSNLSALPSSNVMKTSSNVLYKYSTVKQNVSSENESSETTGIISKSSEVLQSNKNGIPSLKNLSIAENEQNDIKPLLNGLTGPNLINKETLKRISYKKNKRSQSDVNNQYHHRKSFEEQDEQEQKTLQNPTIGKIPSALARSFSPLSFNMVSLKSTEEKITEEKCTDDKNFTNQKNIVQKNMFEESDIEEDNCSYKDFEMEDIHMIEECNELINDSKTVENYKDFTSFMKEYGIGIDKKECDINVDKKDEYNLQMMDDPFSFLEDTNKMKQIPCTSVTPVNKRKTCSSPNSINCSVSSTLLLSKEGHASLKENKEASTLEKKKSYRDNDILYRDDVLNKKNEDRFEKTKSESFGKVFSKDNDPFDNFESNAPFSQTNDTVYQLHTMTLDRDKKKQSKLKKFFRKLASKKDDNKVEFEYCGIREPSTPTHYGVVNDSISTHATVRPSDSCLSNHIDQKFKAVSDHEESNSSVTTSNCDYILRCNSSDSSLFGENMSTRSSNSNSDTDFPIKKKEIFKENISSNSLRRTPLRHVDDSYSKIVEVHKQAVEKIARQVSTLHCSCDSLHELGWDDFERKEDHIQLGLSNYIVIPVKQGDNKLYSAWMNHSSIPDINVDYIKSTLHPNCLHVCHKIVQKHATPQDGIPKTIQINSVYISPMIPKMTLSKYVSLTLEKHTLIPEAYERETAMILLQTVKGLQHLYKNNLQISSINCENIFILDTGEHSVVLSPRKKPNRCPSIIVGELPGMNCLLPEKKSMITTVCHELAFVLYELLHCPYHDELRDAHDIPMLQATLPTLTIKSIYTRYLQIVINFLVGSYMHTIKTLRDIRLMLEVLLFGPTEIDKSASLDLITKWQNRRCVDIVTHLLQATPIIMLTGTSGKCTPIDQEIILESEFLSEISPEEIQSISFMLNR